MRNKTLSPLKKDDFNFEEIKTNLHSHSNHNCKGKKIVNDKKYKQRKLWNQFNAEETLKQGK